ncbi:ATP-dependent nuclease [Microbacterium sp. ASV49]|uniref:AAA family ATPase n=1 Tax=Microbacterium candidum TaxID=3041922 RepID=A0ABT7N3D0_9MICO|nr:AAA family ATPase [Microbacterium sp. ASV49]MDL9981200.1 AAA family ATPase [Microbacterium sp. ASV49]
MRVRNYRTVGPEQRLSLLPGMTLVGPNNSGKTNLLRAVQMFFTGYENVLGYRRATDLTFGAGSQQTSLVASFTIDGHARDAEVLTLLDELHAIVGTQRDSDTFTVNLYFTGVNDTPVYRVFGNVKVPVADRPTFSRKQKQLVELLLGTFRVHYVPSAKSITSLYDDLLKPFVTHAAFQAIEPHLDGIQAELDSVAQSLNEELNAVGLSGIQSSFRLPTRSTDLLAGFELMLSDPSSTTLSEKGQGIQSTVLFASFAWITEQEKLVEGVPLWLIEEPESYLHPELTKALYAVLETLSNSSTVVATTHSLAFVPTDHSLVQGVDLDPATRRTVVSDFRSHAEATQRIRRSLGVQFSDYYNLAECNVFLEGPSDKELMLWALSQLDPNGVTYPLLGASLLEDFGGVKQLEGFLKATYAPIRDERALVAVFDGDSAGQQSRQNLQQYFGQKEVPFDPNRDFVSVRNGFAVEGLFPDEAVMEMHDQHSSWFQTYSVDSSGDLEPFQIKDGRKSDAIRFLKQAAPSMVDWDRRWLSFLSAIDSALQTQIERLARQQ